MEVYVSLSKDEILELIPYAIVCETMSGAKWNTGRRKRLMKERFTESEIKAVSRLHQQARSWYLIKGLPEELVIKPKTIHLWNRLAEFCCEL